MSLTPMWPVRWKLSQSPGKSPGLLLEDQSNSMILLLYFIYDAKLPDVVRSHARTGGADADRHAPPVCLALGLRPGGAMGRTGDHDSDAGVAGGGAGGDAPCRLFFLSGGAPWRRRPTCGGAG